MTQLEISPVSCKAVMERPRNVERVAVLDLSQKSVWEGVFTASPRPLIPVTEGPHTQTPPSILCQNP
jgi:hypothetical protein